MSLASCAICWEVHCEHQCPQFKAPFTPQLVIVGNDDWWGIYQDGKLIHEGHDSPFSQIFLQFANAAGIKLDIRHADYDWMCDEMGGRLPESLRDVKYGPSR